MKGIKKFLIYAWVWLASLWIFSTQNVYSRDIESAANNTAPVDWTSSTKDTWTSTKALEDWWHTLESILAMLYGLMWPLIAIAWTALSNDIVVWKVFWLDRALFDFWSIMKNIANLTIWFVLVAGILMYMFNNKKWADPKTLIPKFLFAVVWIQASWFLMLALIDIWTITTYAVGWLPLSVENKQVDDNFRMYNVVQMPLKTEWNSVSNLTVYAVFESPSSVKIAMPCITSWSNGWIKPSKPVDWQNYTQPVSKSLETSPIPVINIAPTHEKVVFYSWDDSKALAEKYVWYTPTKAEISDVYCMSNWTRLAAFKGWKNWPESLDFETTQVWGVSVKEYIQGLPATQKASWPLYSLYVSILSMTSLWDVASWGSTPNFILVVILKAFVWLALMIPLAVLAVVMVMRVAFLWIIICFSPLIIMAIALSYNKIRGFEKFLNIWNILSLIFLPTVVTFAMSIWVMFMTSLMTFWATPNKDQLDTKMINWSEFTQVFGIKIVEIDWKTCYQISNQAVTCQQSDKNPLLWIANIFWFLIIWILWAAIMWNILFLALKTSDFTKWMAENIQGFWEWFLKSMPIVPIPWAWMVSTTALWNFYNANMWPNSQIITSRVSDQFNRIQSLVSDVKWADKTKIEEWKTKIKQALAPGGWITTYDTKSEATKVDENKFLELWWSVAGSSNIDEYIDSNDVNWKKTRDKLWNQAWLTWNTPETFSAMMQNPVFAGYMMWKTWKSAQQIMSEFYRKTQAWKVSIDPKKWTFDDLKWASIIKASDNKKIQFVDWWIIVYTKNWEGFDAKFLANGSSDEIKSVLGENITISATQWDIDEGKLRSYWLRKNDNGNTWTYDPNIANSAKLLEDYKTFVSSDNYFKEEDWLTWDLQKAVNAISDNSLKSNINNQLKILLNPKSSAEDLKNAWIVLNKEIFGQNENYLQQNLWSWTLHGYLKELAGKAMNLPKNPTS